MTDTPQAGPYTPSPAAAPQTDFQSLPLAQMVRFGRQYWRFISACGLLAGLTTALVVVLFIPRLYEATATLVIISPNLSSELKPATLTVQGYQKLLESDAVLAEAAQRLVQQGILEEDALMRLGQEVEGRIFVSRKSDVTSLAPMLHAVAWGETPEQAAAMANTWAEVFLERAQTIMRGTTSAAVTFIEREYPQAREQLLVLEHEQERTAEEFQLRRDQAATRWGEQIAASKNETAERIAAAHNQTAERTAAYKTETMRLVEAFMSERNLTARKSKLESLLEAHVKLQGEQAQVSVALQQQQRRLLAVREQLEKTPAFVTLHKAITDDALWQTLTQTNGNAVDWTALQERSLVTEEMNPLYNVLSSRAAELALEVKALSPGGQKLPQELEGLMGRLQELDTSIRQDESRLTKLHYEREVGLTKLTQVQALQLARLEQERALQLAILTRQQRKELDVIERERHTQLGQIERDIAHQQALYAELAAQATQATLATAQQDVEDIRLGAPAVAVGQPQPRGGAVKTIIALFIGSLIGFGTALIRDIAARVEDGA